MKASVVGRMPKRLARQPCPQTWGSRSVARRPPADGVTRFLTRLRQDADGLVRAVLTEQGEAGTQVRLGQAHSASDAIAGALRLPCLFWPSETDEVTVSVAAVRRRPVLIDSVGRVARCVEMG